MKKVIKHSYIIVLSIFIAGLSSCNEFDEFESIDVNTSSNIELSVSEIEDSIIVVDATSSSQGYIVVGLASGNTSTEVDPENFVKQNISDFLYKKAKVEGESSVLFEFSDLVQNTDYVVVAVATNSDGVPSQPASVEVTTTDQYSPNLVETSPTAGFSPVLGIDGELVLYFDEPVNYDETKLITYYGYFSDVTLNEVDVILSTSRDQVTIIPNEEVVPSDLVFVSWEEGTFVDANDNPVDAVNSGLDNEGYPYGLYFGVQPKVYEMVNFSPDNSDAVNALEFNSITVEYEVSVNSFEDGLAKIIYSDPNGDTLTKVVTSDMVTIDGNTFTIDLPVPVVSGQTIELIAEEGAFTIGNGYPGLELVNPSAEINISWEIASGDPI